MSELWRINDIQIKQHSYWDHIEDFILSEDTYPHYSIFCIMNGTFDYKVLGESGQAEPGDIILCPPHIPLKRKAVTPLKFHFFQFTYRGLSGEQLPVGLLQFKDTERLMSTYERLKDIAFNESEHSNHWKAHLLTDIFQIYSMENQLVTIEEEPKIYDTIINQALSHIHEQAYTEISIRELSTYINLSPVQFTRRFQASVGVSPIDYLTSLRLRKARTLLLETDCTIEDIAVRCGYNNGFYFSRIFSKKMKMSPSQFRRTHKI
ncbi:AraC family transcriptional regulator [Fictibacillus nanhaiensis]|uniref:AraC family transcriptional regulator n=1 Tax=Fictibacillus nanhaiensis TaxID=742169 RepID=UPI001C9775AA|nr:AraC family transcriptional regulator [Fictibacillus nanhaiensis]MBY6037178.1 AraC family transcriptional regulator [Fictibacillus nanhaiensis]